jgi:TonB family protein
MKLDINQHIRYCLFLFDNCTVNGLGTFRIIESPPVKDHNGNFIKAEKYSISFTAEHTEKPRLAYFISSKENCTEQEAENLIRKYSKNVSEEIALKNEVWFRELGMLIKKDGELRFVSHKFTAKDLKKQVAVQTAASYTADADNKTVSESLLMHAASSVTSLPPQNNNNNTGLLVEEEDEDFQLEDILETIAPTPPPEVPVTKVSIQPPVVETIAPKEFIPASVPVFQPKHAENNFNKEKKVVFANKLVLSVKAKRQIAYTASFLGSALLLYVFYVFIIGGKSSAKNLQTNLDIAETGNTVNSEQFANPNVNTNGAEFINKKSNSESLTIPVTGSKPAANDLLKDKKKDPVKQDVLNNSTASGNNNFIAAENAGLSNTPASNISAESEIPKPNTDLTASNKELPSNQPEKTIPVVTNDKPNNAATTIILSQAEFPGGKAKLANYLKRNLVYPETGLDEGKEGTTVVRISVDKNGSVKASEIVNSLGKDFDREIMKVVSRMPKWSPAKQNGESVESSVSFKVEFRYDNKPAQRK